METLLPIGQAAAKLGLRASALRYYDDIGLVPAIRRRGQRHYGASELRRLALIQMLGRVGVGLDVAGAVLDEPREAWRDQTQAQIEKIDALIAEATAARALLEHLLECPAEHPVTGCPTMGGLLDRRVAGESLEQLAAAEGQRLPSRQRHAPKR